MQSQGWGGTGENDRAKRGAEGARTSSQGRPKSSNKNPNPGSAAGPASPFSRNPRLCLEHTCHQALCRLKSKSVRLRGDSAADGPHTAMP